MEFSITSVLFLFFGILSLIEGNGYVEIKWISYWNQYGKTARGKHCDSGLFGRTSLCDLRFYFKLDGKDSSGKGPDWPEMKSKTYYDTDSVTFGSYFGSTYANPFKLRFTTWQGRLNLKVTTHDVDILKNDHVDTLRKTITANPGTWTRKVEMSSSFHGHRAGLTFTYKVACSQFYYGKFCNKYCKPANDNSGHFTCDTRGNKRCLPGWKIPDKRCNTKISPCDQIKCENEGKCLLQLDKPICNCPFGYNGPRCQNAISTSTTITTTTLSRKQEIKTTSRFNSHERKRNRDSSYSGTQVTTRKPSTTGPTKDPFADKKKASPKGSAKQPSTTTNTSDSSNVYGFKVAANVGREVAKQDETKSASIHPAIFTIPLFLIILLLVGALYHQRQRLHKAFSIMKLSNSAAGNGAEVGNIYTEGLIDPDCEGRVRYVNNNTYNVDPAILQNCTKSEDENGSLYGSISSKSDTDEEEIMDENLYSLPKDPKRFRNEKDDNLLPPSLPPRDINNKDHSESDMV